MTKKLILLLTIVSITNTFSQEKKIWATSFIHQKAPEFVVEKWLTEKPTTKGKFILLDFWATWCGPCKKAIPELNKYHQKYADKLVVIGLSDEPKSIVTNFKEPKIEYYSSIDTKKRLMRLYGVRGIPHCVIINPSGVVVWEGWPQLKGFELTEETIENLLKNYQE